MVTFSAFADEVTDDFAGQLAFLNTRNISHIEIRFVNGINIMELDKTALSETRKMLKDNGISVSAIGSPIGKVRLDEPFEQHLDKFKHAIDLAEFFDTSFIRIFSYYAPDGKQIDNYRDEVIERMMKKVALLKGSEIVLVHENEAHIFGHSAKNCLTIARAVDSSHLKLVYDPANFVWSEHITNNTEVCWPLMKEYVAHVHIKDWKLESADVGSLPGEGDGQIRELLQELSAMRYAGFLTMEPHLRSGGQFGGETGPELFAQAIDAARALCNAVCLEYQ